MGKTNDQTRAVTPPRQINLSDLRGQTPRPQWQRPAVIEPPQRKVSSQELIAFAAQLVPDQAPKSSEAALEIILNQERYDDHHRLSDNPTFSSVGRFRQWIALVKRGSNQLDVVAMRSIAEAEGVMETWRVGRNG